MWHLRAGSTNDIGAIGPNNDLGQPLCFALHHPRAAVLRKSVWKSVTSAYWEYTIFHGAFAHNGPRVSPVHLCHCFCGAFREVAWL